MADVCSKLPTKQEIIDYVNEILEQDNYQKIAWYQDHSDEKEFSAPVVELLEINKEIHDEKKTVLTWIDAARLLANQDEESGQSTLEGIQKGIMPWGIPDPYTVADILRMREDCPIGNPAEVAKKYLMEIASPILDVLTVDDPEFVFTKGQNIRELMAPVVDADLEEDRIQQTEEYSSALMSLRILVQGWVGKNSDYIGEMHRDIAESPLEDEEDMEEEAFELIENLVAYYDTLD